MVTEMLQFKQFANMRSSTFEYEEALCVLFNWNRLASDIVLDKRDAFNPRLIFEVGIDSCALSSGQLKSPQINTSSVRPILDKLFDNWVVNVSYKYLFPEKGEM